MPISALVVADSINPWGNRLTSIQVVLPRMVLAELNTHRVFSRNSASSRAIPVERTLRNITMEPFAPLVWASEQKGMQGGPPLEGDDLADAKEFWDQACDMMTGHVARYIAQHPTSEEGQVRLHKSLLNRVLEPFMWHTVLVTSAEWDNFWQQRLSPLAQPEFRIAAEAMRAAFDASTPTMLDVGEWHMPYATLLDPAEADDIISATGMSLLEIAKRVSVARCARVSYLTHDGNASIAADLDLYDRLVSANPPHWSPLEHVATPTLEQDIPGNFGYWNWAQLRHTLTV